MASIAIDYFIIFFSGRGNRYHGYHGIKRQEKPTNAIWAISRYRRLGISCLWACFDTILLFLGILMSSLSIQSDDEKQLAKDQKWMKYALSLADQAERMNEIPVGAVLVKDDQVISEGWNLSINEHDACAHAEIIALRAAGKQLQNYRLIDCTLYVTLEPCPMCAGALVHARIKRLVYGAGDYKTGAAGSVFNLLQNEQLNHQVEITAGVLDNVCATKISEFFKRRRKEKKALKKQQTTTS